MQNYAFVQWIVLDENGDELEPKTYEPYFEFENIKSSNTNIIPKKMGTGFIIEPYCEKRPVVAGSTPLLANGLVYKDTPIKIIFSQSMSEKSFYWTENEFEEMSIESGSYSSYICKDSSGNLKDENKNQYYYAYKDSDGGVHFKNITIVKMVDEENIADKFGQPYFETSDNSVLIIPPKGKDAPSNVDIEYSVSSEVQNVYGIGMVSEYTQYYSTSEESDGVKPTWTNGTVTTGPYDISEFPQITTKDYVKGLVKKILIADKQEREIILSSVKKQFVNTVNVKGSLQDEMSKPAKIEVVFTIPEDGRWLELQSTRQKSGKSLLPPGQFGSKMISKVIQIHPNDNNVKYNCPVNGLVFDFTDSNDTYIYYGTLHVYGYDNSNNKTELELNLPNDNKCVITNNLDSLLSL